jgi:hypothetical protein
MGHTKIGLGRHHSRKESKIIQAKQEMFDLGLQLEQHDTQFLSVQLLKSTLLSSIKLLNNNYALCASATAGIRRKRTAAATASAISITNPTSR